MFAGDEFGGALCTVDTISEVASDLFVSAALSGVREFESVG